MKSKNCIFCNIDKDKIILQNEKAFAIEDKYPQSMGHLLIIPHEHYEDFFELPEDVLSAMMALLKDAKNNCDAEYSPTGFNINVNNGRSAGQIIMHSHIHLIPRYK